MSVEGSAALVTGGSRGIGRAIVRQLSDAGSRVAVLDVQARDGDGDVALVCDVADEKAVVAGVAAATERLAGLDLAFLNAGVGGLAPLLAMTAEEWDRTHDVNLRGTFLCLRECARAMEIGRASCRERGKGWGGGGAITKKAGEGRRVGS